MTATLAPEINAVLFPVAEKKGWRALPQKVGGAVLDLLFPPHCGVCNEPLATEQNVMLCAGCAAKIRWIGADRCARCGAAVGQGAGVMEDCPDCRPHPPAHIQGACALAQYADGPLRDLILGLKFGRQLHFVPSLAALLAQRITQTKLYAPALLVVPTALTRESLQRRGFNQAGELAQQIARRLKLECAPRLLRKIRHTPPQATLSHEQRRENLRDAFACHRRSATMYEGRPVLLIDDVITTGSTIAECARTLKAAGLGAICAAALARG